MRKDVWSVEVEHDSSFSQKQQTKIAVLTKRKNGGSPDIEAAAKKAKAVIHRQRARFRNGRVVLIVWIEKISE